MKQFLSEAARLTDAQCRWLLKAEKGKRYSFLSDAVGWREVGRPLKEAGLVQWVADARISAVVLTGYGQKIRDELIAQP